MDDNESPEIQETRAAIANQKARAVVMEEMRDKVTALVRSIPGSEQFQFFFYVHDAHHTAHCFAHNASRDTCLCLVELLAELNNAKLITFRAPG